MPHDPLDDLTNPTTARTNVASSPTTGWAASGGIVGLDPLECIDVLAEPERLETGRWFVIGEFDGPIRAWRFARHLRVPHPWQSTPAWAGPGLTEWRTSLDQPAYLSAVDCVRSAIRDGDAYQVNICRVLTAPLAARGPNEPDAAALHERLTQGNPSPYAAAIHVPARSGVTPVWVVSASPELYLSRDDDVLTSGPIKGTATDESGLRPKDRAENVMIVDLVRNDLQRVGIPGTVEVAELLAVEAHPGLVHLVSRVQTRLLADVTWAHIFEATFPPASVCGAPKSSAQRLIRDLEPVPRGPYCGAIGWVDGASRRAQLAVGIRTFWWTNDTLHFGTGAGITWGSEANDEWIETQLKSSRLIALASGSMGT